VANEGGSQIPKKRDSPNGAWRLEMSLVDRRREQKLKPFLANLVSDRIYKTTTEVEIDIWREKTRLPKKGS